VGTSTLGVATGTVMARPDVTAKVSGESAVPTTVAVQGNEGQGQKDEKSGVGRGVGASGLVVFVASLIYVLG
jgi:hypothetical protein